MRESTATEAPVPVEPIPPLMGICAVLRLSVYNSAVPTFARILLMMVMIEACGAAFVSSRKILSSCSVVMNAFTGGG